MSNKAIYSVLFGFSVLGLSAGIFFLIKKKKKTKIVEAAISTPETKTKVSAKNVENKLNFSRNKERLDIINKANAPSYHPEIKKEDVVSGKINKGSLSPIDRDRLFRDTQL
jgi:hypothetical protein